jgi:hypothetical protein
LIQEQNNRVTESALEDVGVGGGTGAIVDWRRSAAIWLVSRTLPVGTRHFARRKGQHLLMERN